MLLGGIVRPSLRELRPDAWTARFLARIGPSWYRDGSLLDAIAATLEGEGFRVVAPETFASSLAAQAHRYGRLAPNEADRADIARGFEVVRALGALDIGQATIVQQWRVIGVEAAEGTDALIERCGPLLTRRTRRAGQGVPARSGCADRPADGWTAHSRRRGPHRAGRHRHRGRSGPCSRR